MSDQLENTDKPIVVERPKSLTILLKILSILWLLILGLHLLVISLEDLEFVSPWVTMLFTYFSLAGTSLIFCLGKFRKVPFLLCLTLPVSVALGGTGLYYAFDHLTSLTTERSTEVLFTHRKDPDRTIVQLLYHYNHFTVGLDDYQQPARVSFIDRKTYFGIVQRDVPIRRLEGGLHTWNYRKETLVRLRELCERGMNETGKNRLYDCRDGSCCFQIH